MVKRVLSYMHGYCQSVFLSAEFFRQWDMEAFSFFETVNIITVYCFIRNIFQCLKCVWWDRLIISTSHIFHPIYSLKEHNLICLPNKIRLNLINTFVMSRNKHISKKTPCFSRKRSKNKAKPNEFERRILKLSCYAYSDNPKCWHALTCLEMRVARMNFDLTFYDVWLRPPLPRYNNRTLKNWIKLDENEIWQLSPTKIGPWFALPFPNSATFLSHFRVWTQAFKARLSV